MAIAIVHACLAQLQFGMAVALAAQVYGMSPSFSRPVLLALLLVQIALGAAVRYGVIGLAAHLGGALIATIFVMWAALSTLMNNMDNPARRRPAMLLLSLTFSQIFLGIASYMARVVYVNAPQPMPILVGFTVAHVAFGALVFGAAVLFTATARTATIPATGGMVTA
jgi:heme A synthase